jgi:hypothetical protein
MLIRVCLSLALLAAMPGWSQAAPGATGSGSVGEDNSQMHTPPPVSGEAYPTATGSESRSNYLRTGFSLDTSYDDKVLGGSSATPVSDTIYSIRTSIALDQSTPRLHQTLSYSPGFTFYQHTSALNAADQSGSVKLQYRLSPHLSLNVADSVQKTSNVFNLPYGTVPGSNDSSTGGAVAAFADEISNSATAEASYQLTRNGMIGGSGGSTIFDYLHAAQAGGLPNSKSLEGSAFYNLRLTSTQYTGLTYQYSKMVATPVTGQSDTRVSTLSLFYTLYLGHALTLSVSGGPQHFNTTQSPLPASGSWTPSLTTSAGWQRSRTNLAASYGRTVTGAGGLLGAFHSTKADATVRWQLARNWTIGGGASYDLQKNVLPAILSASPGGRTVSGTASLDRPIGAHLSASLKYQRLHQSYGGIPVLSNVPDSNNEVVSISYQFTRPLGR